MAPDERKRLEAAVAHWKGAWESAVAREERVRAILGAERGEPTEAAAEKLVSSLREAITTLNNAMEVAKEAQAGWRDAIGIVKGGS